MPAILIVEDEVDLLSVLVSALEHALPEYELLQACDAAQAHDALAQLKARGEPLAMAIADYHLGADDGLQVLVSVRQQHPDTPTLMVTGQAPVEIEDQARDMGTRVLWKPVNLHQFLQTVQALLSE